MMKKYALGAIGAFLSILPVAAQLGFTDASYLLSNTTYSGGCMGVVDMNGDGRDDLAKLHMSREFQVDYQNPDGSFTLVDYGEISDNVQWGMSIGDITNNGLKDMISGGNGDGVHYLKIDGMGSSTLSNLNNGGMFMQCNNMADINNDGHNDFFACHDLAAPKIWMNDGNGNLTFDGTVMDFTTDPVTDMSGNYGSVWIDFDNDGDLDLYIAKCRQNVSNPEDPRRWNRLFVNDGNGNYTDMAEEYGVLVKYQSWTGEFGDIDNDGDLDLVVTNHDHTVQLFENDGNGYFTEITAGSGLAITGFFLQSKFADFDNDGYIDLLLSGGIERFFRNNGNKTFTQVNGLFPAAKAMHSFSVGDLNQDGFMDVFTSYGSNYVTPDTNHPDKLFLNNKNSNHWLSVRLQGTESNRDAIGARVTITGPWGTQIREVRAGESYGIVTTFACNFGLGEHTTIPTMTINWPSGLVETFTDVAADQTLTVIEGTCIAPVAEIAPIGASVLCSSGGTVTLEASGANGYLWSNGSTDQQITVSAPGFYSVTLDAGDGCSSSTSFFVPLDPDETPAVSASGGLRICEGEMVQLTAVSEYPVLWNTGETTTVIDVEQSGTYTVTIEGTCASFTSAPIEVEVLASPDAPTADDVTIGTNDQAELFADGMNIEWYDQPSGGNVLATTNAFTTPNLTQTTSYWVSAGIAHGGDTIFGGKENNGTPGGFHNNANFYQLFEAYEAFTLVSVKVYANGAGNRTIAIIDQSNGSTVISGSFAIPDGESRVQLNFQVPSAGSYGLRVVGGNPQLWRDQAGSGQSYPYALGDVGAITSSTAGDELYYFFYDWEVALPTTICRGPLTEVVVTVGPVGINEMSSDVLRVWPNPADASITIELPELDGKVSIVLSDMLGRRIMDRTGPGADQARQITMDVSDLSAGDYLLEVRHQNGSMMRHLIIN